MSVISETDRTIIREITLSDHDIDGLYEVYSGPHMTDFIEPLFKREEEIEYERNYIERVYPYYGYGLWLIEEKGTGIVLGRAGLEYREGCRENEAELGFEIREDRWREGFAFEVTMECLRLAFSTYSFGSVMARVSPENTASVNLVKKLGMTDSGESARSACGRTEVVFRIGKEDFIYGLTPHKE